MRIFIIFFEFESVRVSFPPSIVRTHSPFSLTSLLLDLQWNFVLVASIASDARLGSSRVFLFSALVDGLLDRGASVTSTWAPTLQTARKWPLSWSQFRAGTHSCSMSRSCTSFFKEEVEEIASCRISTSDFNFQSGSHSSSGLVSRATTM